LFCVVSFVSFPSHEIGWDERLRNALFCVKWEVKHCSIHSSSTCDLTVILRSTQSTLKGIFLTHKTREVDDPCFPVCCDDIIPVFDADKQLQSGDVNKRKCAVAELVTNYS